MNWALSMDYFVRFTRDQMESFMILILLVLHYPPTAEVFSSVIQVQLVKSFDKWQRR